MDIITILLAIIATFSIAGVVTFVLACIVAYEITNMLYKFNRSNLSIRNSGVPTGLNTPWIHYGSTKHEVIATASLCLQCGKSHWEDQAFCSDACLHNAMEYEMASFDYEGNLTGCHDEESTPMIAQFVIEAIENAVVYYGFNKDNMVQWSRDTVAKRLVETEVLPCIEHANSIVKDWYDDNYTVMCDATDGYEFHEVGHVEPHNPMDSMDNPFEWCRKSDVAEATLVCHFWALSMVELTQYTEQVEITVDLELCAVYMEWLDEYCAVDLRTTVYDMDIDEDIPF